MGSSFIDWIIDTYGDFAGGAILMTIGLICVGFAILLLSVAFAISPYFGFGLLAAFPAYFWYKYKTRADQ